MSYFGLRVDVWAFLLILLFIPIVVLFIRWCGRFRSPQLFFSNLFLMSQNKTTWKERFFQIPFWMKNFALAIFVIAFLDPHYLIEKSSKESTEGIAIFLLTDRSGSMKETIQTFVDDNTMQSITKIELLKKLTKKFVPSRSNDLIGVLAFARTAIVLAPLTLDHQTVLDELSILQPVANLDQDGTAIGYAILKAATIIAETRHYAQEEIGTDRPAYKIRSAAIIVVTDGFHAPNPMDEGNPLRSIDLISAAKYAKSKDTRLYIVTIEPALASEKFSAHRHLMQKASELTGGKAFMVDQATSLKQIFVEIDKLEKSLLPDIGGKPEKYVKVSFYPYILAVGLLVFFVGIFLESTILRVVP